MSLPEDQIDVEMMGRAIALARLGRGGVEPNPMVGCVIARGHTILGEGYHQRFGAPHAEPNALDDCARHGTPAGATAYVTLEPCSHLNKKTPPCAPRLIQAGVARVVIGCLDPNPAVNGNGIAILRAAGVEVTRAVRETECQQLIAPFICRMRLKRSYVTLKWAESSDRKVAGPGGERTQISNAASSRAVHRLRGRCDAIVIGVNTALNDDPLLLARGVESPRPLTRVVLSRNLNLRIESRLLSTTDQGPVIVATTAAAVEAHPDRVRAIRSAGGEVLVIGRLGDLLDPLVQRGATHVLVEPGPTLAAAWFAEAPIDRVWVIRSPSVIGHHSAPNAPNVPAEYLVTDQADLSGDVLTEYLNPASGAFFGSFPSADFLDAGG